MYNVIADAILSKIAQYDIQ